MILDFERTQFKTEPYPIGLATNVLKSEEYGQLINAWPSEKLFVHMTGNYDKYSLSEKNNPQVFFDFLKQTPIWLDFFKFIKGGPFVYSVAKLLSLAGLHPFQGQKVYGSRFEFSSLPAQGGMLAPHTDIPSKAVTLILPM